MERVFGPCVALALVLALGADAAAADEGQVTLPLDDWQAMLDEIAAAAEPELPSLPVCRVDRRIEGAFDKGLFTATLTETFEVLESRGHVRVPVLDGSVSIGEVLLDGQRTSLLKEGEMYTLGIERPGRHRLQLTFYWGEDQDRFARRLKFRLPDGGPTRVQVSVPEVDIEARFAAGALVRAEVRAGRTVIEGQLDSTGTLDLSWTRKLTHRAAAAVALETRVNTLFTVGEAMVSGKTVVDVTVREGETDVFELALPAGLEVLAVDGEAVLQWRTESTGGGRLTVLLRYLVADRTRITIHFQAPAGDDPVQLRMPLPLDGTPLTGAAGVQGPAGLKIQLAGIDGARELAARDLPPELTELTSSPLLFGFAFTAAPAIGIRVARQEQVALTSTLVEELQASTVLVEDGTEVTKVKIRIRNNTREYLALHLPADAVLTHSLIDGAPVRPAISTVDGAEALLFPLRQSERIAEGGARFHRVRPGETLSDIANFYYSDPSRWSMVLEANPDQLYSASAVTAGQQLKIPAVQGAAVEESSFVIELAYKSKREPLGGLGNLDLTLPELDVDTMRVTWHLYLPSSLDALSFDANLTQYSAIRYDPFRRVIDFLDRALWIQDAWAGGRYENILTQRKAIYRTEKDQRNQGEVVRATFPLVGERYRFKRILLGRETPRISVTYVTRTASQLAHYGALVVAFLVTLLVLRSPRELRAWIVAGACLLGLLLLGHYLLGVHRRIIWGIDLALIVALARLRAGPAWQRFKEIVYSPWLVIDLLTFRNLFFAIGLVTVIALLLAFPLLLSSAAAVLLALWWRHRIRRAGEEVRHA